MSDYTPVARRTSAGDPQDVTTAVRMLLGASRPVIQAGQGVLYAEACDELLEVGGTGSRSRHDHDGR